MEQTTVLAEEVFLTIVRASITFTRSTRELAIGAEYHVPMSL